MAALTLWQQVAVGIAMVMFIPATAANAWFLLFGMVLVVSTGFAEPRIAFDCFGGLYGVVSFWLAVKGISRQFPAHVWIGLAVGVVAALDVAFWYKPLRIVLGASLCATGILVFVSYAYQKSTTNCGVQPTPKDGAADAGR